MEGMQQQESLEGRQAPLRFGLTALLLGNLALAFGPWFVRMADTGPVASAFWRILLAAPFLFVLAGASGQPAKRPSRGLLLIFLISGALFAADLAAWHLGIVRTKLANSNLLGNSTSFLLPAWAFFAARQWPTRIQGLALTLAGAGAVLLIGRSFELSPQHFAGDLLCLLAGAFYTGYLVLMARVREGMAPLPVLAWSTLGSVLPLLLIALFLGERIMPGNWTPLILMALLSQIIGQGLMIYAAPANGFGGAGLDHLWRAAGCCRLDWRRADRPGDGAGAGTRKGLKSVSAMRPLRPLRSQCNKPDIGRHPITQRDEAGAKPG
jgi:drug/metabolite transporter (DMT)-like permease